ncbi:MAG: aldehyde dehydrogenase family protein, partial [Thermoanaerobaculia bacterium]
MSASSPEQIRHLAQLIARELVAEGSTGPPPPSASPGAGLGGGVFSKLDDAVAAASAAFRALDALGLEKRHAIIESMREAMRQNARPLAALAVEETGLGRVEDKVQKNLLVTNKTLGPEELAPQATSGDHGLALIEPAPFGVIGAITPVTNPSSTIICNSIGMVAAG